MKTEIICDLERASHVVELLDQAFELRTGVFEDVTDLLENQIPAGVVHGSVEHARFLFFLISQDYGTKSSRLYERAKNLYRESPNLFDPSFVVQNFDGPNDLDLVARTGIRLGTRFPSETAKRWYSNSGRLVERFRGDPREIFRMSTDAVTIYNEVRKFRGFGPKIGGLLFRTFVGCGFTSGLFDVDKIMVPVDIHDVRIAFYLSAAKLRNNSNVPLDYHKYAKTIQKLWSDACSQKGVDWLKIDRALWILGSRGCVSLRCHDCALKVLCWKGRSVLKMD